MSAAKGVKIPLRVLINRQKTKVLLAEVDSDFADILLSFLTLPLGKIVRLFQKHYGDKAPVIGSLNTLYNGVANLDSSYFWTNEGKQMLLDPRNLFGDDCRKLKLNLDDSQATKYFTCEDFWCAHKGHLNMNYRNGRCRCGKFMNKEIFTKGPPTEDASSETTVGVFTAKATNFAISDDLQIVPDVSRLIVQCLHTFGITDTEGTEQRTVHLGLNEMVDLLKGSLLSRTPLTDLILNRRPMTTPTPEKYETAVSLHQICPRKEATSSNSKKMVVKAMLQKSTSKLLFVHAEDDFVEFLFSLLVIPLGGVAHLLGGGAPLGSVDNLYRSVASFRDKHLKARDEKTRLLEPQLPHMYLSKSQILPLTEQRQAVSRYERDKGRRTEYLRTASFLCGVDDARFVTINDPKGGKGCYVRGQDMFMVTDDLTVTPSSTLSTISILNKLKIPLSDVEEQELEIGVEEALRILKASLTTTAALTNVLMPILKKQSKNLESDHSG